MPREPERRSSGLPAVLLALALGALLVGGFAPTGAFPLVVVSLGGLFLILCLTVSVRRAAALGFAFGLGAFLAGVSWVYVSMHDFGGMPAALALLATVLFCAYLALYPALAAAAFVHLRRGRPALPTAADGLLFAGCWTLAEWLRGTVLSGFPWLAVGYSQAPPSPLAGFAPLLGVYGVSLLTVWLGAALAAALAGLRSGKACASTGHPAWARATVPLVFALGLLALGATLSGYPWTSARGAPLRVSLLQGNVEQDLKWRPERFLDSMLAYYRLARDHPAPLTIFPETALPAFFDKLPAEYRADLEALARSRHGDFLIGSVVGDARHYTNSVVSLGISPKQSYSKSHLVPLGEFIPPGFAWMLRLMNIPMSEFARGPLAQAPLAVGGQQVAMNICYEDVFGEEIIAALPRASILANVSNTAWFGRSWAQPQHLQIAQMRALESGRPMLRATNTGMTAHITPDGRIAAVLPPFTRAALVVEVQGMSGETPFARWGNLPALLLALMTLAATWRGRRESPPPLVETR